MEDKIKVLYYGLVQNVVGKREEEIFLPADAKAKQLIDALVGKYGESFQNGLLDVTGGLRSNDTVLLDDDNINEMKGLETELKNAKEVAIVVTIPQFGGGARA